MSAPPGSDFPVTSSHPEISEWLRSQWELQLTAFDADPTQLGPGGRAEFLTWNAYALEDEIHEAMDEVGWKPWASSKFFNRDPFVEELVDAFHFLANMMLTAWQPEVQTLEEFAAEFYARYKRKVQKNIDRQREGYTGLDKCPICHRELTKIDYEAERPSVCSEHGYVGVQGVA